MKPGYELDRLISEKIFNMVECYGWQPISFGLAGGMCLQKMCDHKDGVCWPKQTVGNMNGEVGSCPKYSTQFSHTQTLIDKMFEVIPQQDMHIEHIEGAGWQVSTCHEEDGWVGWIEGETIQHAICLAALKLFKI